MIASVASAHKGGTVGDVGLAFCRYNVCIGEIERIADIDGLAVMPAHEAATADGAVGGQHATEVGTACNVQRAFWHCHDAAMSAVVVVVASDCTTMDNGADEAVGDVSRAVVAGDKSCGKLLGSVYVTSHLEVTNGGILDVSERGAVCFVVRLGIVACAECQRLVIAEEGALKRIAFTCPHHH